MYRNSETKKKKQEILIIIKKFIFNEFGILQRYRISTRYRYNIIVLELRSSTFFMLAFFFTISL